MAFFVAVLAALFAIAVISLFLPTTSVEGLPADPSAHAARDLMFGRAIPLCGGLRFGSAFLGEAPPPPARPPDGRLIARGQALLERARAAHPLEPRVVAALGHLELSRRRLDRAIALYRSSLDLRAHCSEARLGLGIALALESEGAPDALVRRRLALQSLAQFAAIEPGSALALEAQYDRAVMLARVGRRAEARSEAARYWSRDSSGAWAERLNRELAAAK